MRRNVLVLVCLVTALLLVTACSKTEDATGSAVAATGEVKEVHIDMYNWGFTQDPVSIKKGDKVRLTVTTSSGVHGISIPELGISTGKIGVGEEQVLEFTATESGTFDYFCNVPCGKGHRSMKGTIVVE